MGMKVFTDSESQFKASIFQSTASSLKMEPVQTNAANLHTTVKQTSAANLYANVRNSTSASLLNATVKQTNAANLHVTTHPATTSVNMKLQDRATLDITSALGVTTSADFNSIGGVQTVITLSKFSFLVKGGTVSTNIKIQLSPNGLTAASNWLDDDTLTRTLTASALTILTPTRFSKYMRFVSKLAAGTATTSITVYYQGHV